MKQLLSVSTFLHSYVISLIFLSDSAAFLCIICSSVLMKVCQFSLKLKIAGVLRFTLRFTFYVRFVR